jgi:hypothetical protein
VWSGRIGEGRPLKKGGKGGGTRGSILGVWAA